MLYIKAIVHAQGRSVECLADGGAHLLTLVQEAHTLGQKLECGIHFEFNGHTVFVSPEDDPATLYVILGTRWGLKLE